MIKPRIAHVKLFVINFNQSPSYNTINRKIHGCLEIPDLFLVLNMMAYVCVMISCSILEINMA